MWVRALKTPCMASQISETDKEVENVSIVLLQLAFLDITPGHVRCRGLASLSGAETTLFAQGCLSYV